MQHISWMMAHVIMCIQVLAIAWPGAEMDYEALQPTALTRRRTKAYLTHTPYQAHIRHAHYDNASRACMMVAMVRPRHILYMYNIWLIGGGSGPGRPGPCRWLPQRRQSSSPASLPARPSLRLRPLWPLWPARARLLPPPQPLPQWPVLTPPRPLPPHSPPVATASEHTTSGTSLCQGARAESNAEHGRVATLIYNVSSCDAGDL